MKHLRLFKLDKEAKSFELIYNTHGLPESIQKLITGQILMGQPVETFPSIYYVRHVSFPFVFFEYDDSLNSFTIAGNNHIANIRTGSAAEMYYLICNIHK